MTEDSNRLPKTVSPTHYDLTILTDLDNLHYSGTALITVNVHETVESIILHAAKPLTLNESKGFLTSASREGGWFGKSKGASKRALTGVIYHGEKAELQFEGGKIEKGTYNVGLRWTGELNNSMKGYYYSTYPSKNAEKSSGKNDIFACTQFQPTSARRAFPCFDEPEFKAIWKLSMISRVGTTSLNNMHVTNTQRLVAPLDHNLPEFPRNELFDEDFYQDDDTPEIAKEGGEVKNDALWELVEFAPTPLLSSYLVVFANGHFEHKSDELVLDNGARKIPLRIYATWDQVDQAMGINSYENIFQIPYPLKKFDTLVVGDFDLGAMEGFGLTTGRTSVYCFDEKNGGSIADRKRVVSVTSHEISHMWFGDMVTLNWWSSLWLNEAFATLMGECLMIDRLEPSWNPNEAFVSDHLSYALKLDALRSSHPIEMPCPDESTISQIFDGISYSKGGSVLKMLCNWIGEDKFLAGVTLYLKAHLWGNTKTGDLWDGIAESSGKDIASIMDAWTNKIGFPYLRVEETETGLKLTQHRFLSSGDAKSEEDQTLWKIPLQLLTVDPETGEKRIDNSLLMTEREMTVDLAGVDKASYKLNADTCGVYRVLYPESRLSRLGDEAVSTTTHLSVTDRMGLVSDASVLALSGHSRTSSFLSLANQLAPSESEYLVLEVMATALNAISDAWWEEGEDTIKSISNLKQAWFSKVAKRLGLDPIEGEKNEDIELRSLSWGMMAKSNDPDTIAEYQRRFAPFLESNDMSLIPADLLTSIFRNCVANGGEREYKKALEVARARPNPSLHAAAIAALCSTRDPALIQKTLDLALSTEVKNQDVPSFFMNLAANPLAKRKLWKLLQEHLAELTKRFEGNFLIGHVIGSCFRTFSTERDAQGVIEFFKDKDTHLFQQALDQGIEVIRNNAAWLERDREDVAKWLRAR